MADKVFDIDEYLDAKAVKVVIKGREYVVRDIPEDIFDVDEDEQTMRKFCAKVIGCPEEELQDYGLVGLAGLVEWLRENLLPEGLLASGQ